MAIWFLLPFCHPQILAVLSCLPQTLAVSAWLGGIFRFCLHFLFLTRLPVWCWCSGKCHFVEATTFVWLTELQHQYHVSGNPGQTLDMKFISTSVLVLLVVELYNDTFLIVGHISSNRSDYLCSCCWFLIPTIKSAIILSMSFSHHSQVNGGWSPSSGRCLAQGSARSASPVLDLLLRGVLRAGELLESWRLNRVTNAVALKWIFGYVKNKVADLQANLLYLKPQAWAREEIHRLEISVSDKLCQVCNVFEIISALTDSGSSCVTGFSLMNPHK